MTSSTAPLWTIDELGAQVALALSVDYEGPQDSRAREVPDRRTIRYYTTLGLIDRPAEMRGRTALYGRRHLVQLVAIKRLQARGHSLAEVQQQLLGLSDAALVRLAQVPDLDNLSARAGSSEPAPERGEPFWATIPGPGPDTQSDQEAPAGLPWQGLPLGEQVLLLFEPSRTVDETDVAALQAAAAPLLKLLQARRLLRQRQERGTP
jgi:DNA-binding transcriptional MerR regulator